MSNLSAILGGVAAAAPGAAQGVSNIQGDMAAKAVKQGMPAIEQGVTSALQSDPNLKVQAMSPAQLDSGQTGMPSAPPVAAHPMTDASHPFWNVMSSLAGGGGAAPAASGGAIPAMENGGVVRSNYGKPTRAPGFEGDGRGVIPASTQAPPSGYQNGGVVRQSPIQVGAGRDMTGVGQGVIPASTEGQVLTMAGGGPVPDGGVAPAGADGGFIPNSESVQAPMTGGPAGFVSGFAEGQNIGHNLEQAWMAHRAREANAQASDAANTDPTQMQQPAQPSAMDKARDAVEGFFQHLHDHTLGENDKPNHMQAVPAQPGQPAQPGAAAPTDATAAVKAAAVTGQKAMQSGAAQPQAQAMAQKAAAVTARTVGAQQAQQDEQQGGPAPIPHSQTTDYWEESNRKMVAAAHAMALAGENPFVGMQAMQAARTAHYQGQIQRYLSGAYTAYQRGDTQGVVTALKNMNYYLPNGQDLEVRKATADDVKAGRAQDVGSVMLKNPMYGIPGELGKNEWEEVNNQSLYSWGQAALDPQTVQQAALSTYSAVMNAQAKVSAAEGARLTGEGRYEWGLGMRQKADADAQLVPVRKYLSFALGKKAEAEANWFNDRAATTKGLTGPKITFPALQQAQQNAIKAVDGQIRGATTMQPPYIAGPPGPDGKPTQIPNPAAGKEMPDASTAGSLFKGLSPDQRVATERLAATFAGANIGNMNSVEAAELAARVVRMQGAKVMPTHIDPATKKPANDIIFDPKRNTVHVWVGNGWQNAYIQPNISEAALSTDQMPSDSDGATAAAMGGGGGGDDGAYNMNGP